MDILIREALVSDSEVLTEIFFVSRGIIFWCFVG